MESAVQKALGTTLFQSTGRGGGGCISSGSSYTTDHGTVFVKVNDKQDALAMFRGERAGLEAILATGTVRCPKPLAIVEHGSEVALVMENLDMTSITGCQQEVLGEQLARMHLHNKAGLDKGSKEESRINKSSRRHQCEDEYGGECGGNICPVSKFGFDVPTCCGYLRQDNTWQDDWTVFYIRQKLQPHVDLILSKDGSRDLVDIWPVCRQKIESHLSKLTNVVPALVHGDLWSGNIASADNTPVIFDPASFFGHSEYDFGIANMFGGLSSRFYESYFKIVPKTDGFSDRERIYELFHHLNHWNHFGSGYKNSAITLMKKICKS